MQIRFAQDILFRSVLVNRPINLDDEMPANAAKIHDEPFNWILPSKLESVQLPIAELLP